MHLVVNGFRNGDTVKVFGTLFAGKSEMLFSICEILFRLAGVNIPSHLVRAHKIDLPDGLSLKADPEHQSILGNLYQCFF